MKSIPLTEENRTIIKSLIVIVESDDENAREAARLVIDSLLLPYNNLIQKVFNLDRAESESWS